MMHCIVCTFNCAHGSRVARVEVVTEANGRLRFGLKLTVAFVLICLAPFFVVLVRSRPFF